MWRPAVLLWMSIVLGTVKCVKRYCFHNSCLVTLYSGSFRWSANLEVSRRHLVQFLAATFSRNWDICLCAALHVQTESNGWRIHSDEVAQSAKKPSRGIRIHTGTRQTDVQLMKDNRNWLYDILERLCCNGCEWGQFFEYLKAEYNFVNALTLVFLLFQL